MSIESKNILEADSVMVDFDGRSVLQNIYIKCEQEEVVGLLGRNGCGKSTLLNCIFGSLVATHKSVRINGQWVHCGYLDGRISMLPQFGMVPSDIRVRTAIELFNIDVSLINMYAPKIIPLLDSKPASISGGERRLIELLLILFSRSQFCLLDEPFSGLSPVVIEQVIEIFGEVKKKKGILVTDHLHRYVTLCSDRFYIMINGSTRELSDASDLMNFGYVNAVD